jgi:tetratricopeptide (TPR) repeat protein
MRQLVAAIAVRRGDAATAVSLLSTALADPDLAEPWRTRHRVLLAQVRRGDLSDLDRADRDAVEQIESGDGYEVAFGLQTRWLVASIRRDHAAALGYIDRAIEVARGDEHAARLMPDLLDNRVFSLHNLDRLDEAETTLAAAAALESEDGRLTALSVARVIHHYWLGRWDEALTEIAQVTDDDPVISFDGTREPAALALLLHGVAALIAARRGELASALRHLERAGTELPATPAERESCDFLLCARAIVYGQQGRPADALAAMAPLWEPSFAPMMLRHQWLPAAMGLALRIGDDDVVRQVSAICAHEAAQEHTPARAWAADAVVRALLTGDPEPAMAAAQHYAQVGRLPERATALEEASRLLTRAGRTREAAAALAEAIELFERLGATWNLELARAPFGLVRVGRHETAHGVAGAGSAVA